MAMMSIEGHMVEITRHCQLHLSIKASSDGDWLGIANSRSAKKRLFGFFVKALRIHSFGKSEMVRPSVIRTHCSIKYSTKQTRQEKSILKFEFAFFNSWHKCSHILFSAFTFSRARINTL